MIVCHILCMANHILPITMPLLILSRIRDRYALFVVDGLLGILVGIAAMVLIGISTMTGIDTILAGTSATVLCEHTVVIAGFRVDITNAYLLAKSSLPAWPAQYIAFSRS
jgi:hypothetical protein